MATPIQEERDCYVQSREASLLLLARRIVHGFDPRAERREDAEVQGEVPGQDERLQPGAVEEAVRVSDKAETQGHGG